MLHNFLNPLKQATASLSEALGHSSVAPGPALAAASLDSQLGFTWESPSPALVAAISHCYIAQAGWPWEKHRWELTLTCNTWENPEPAPAVVSYRPHQSTTTLALHS